MRWTAIVLVALCGCGGSRIPYSGSTGPDGSEAGSPTNLMEADAGSEPGDDASLGDVGEPGGDDVGDDVEGASPDSSDATAGPNGDASAEGDSAGSGGDAGTTKPGSDATDAPSDGGEASDAGDGGDGPTGCATDSDCPADGLPPCTVPACDAGTCGAHPAGDGTPCDDGDPCTEGTCAAGACMSGPPMSCDDGSACTVDTCVAGTGCSHVYVACDDGDPCTLDTCSTITGCVSLPLPEGATCGPTVGCVALECHSGACGAVPRSCDDDDPCTVDSCEEAKGCVYVEDPEATDCCKADSACDDGNPCTDESCDSTGGCVYTAAPGPCTDGSACTVGDACADGECAGAPVDCADGNPCTLDACNIVLGCVHPVAPDGTVCGDGDPCLDFACQAGACATAPVSCDDGNPCTADWCGPGGTCHNDAVGDAIEGCCTVDAHCDDHDLCTVDQCDKKTLQCEHTAELGSYLNEAFDAPGLPGVELWSNGGAVGFGPSKDRFMSPPQALYLGSPATKTYEGGVVHATATLPPIDVPAQGAPVLGFWLWQDVQDKDCVYDTLKVLVNGKKVLEQCASTKGWVPRTVDLAQLAGTTVTISFEFDSRDAEDNAGEGVYIDDVLLLDSEGSATSCCTADTDCPDGALCTNAGGVCLAP